MTEFDIYRVYRDCTGRRWKCVGISPDSMLLRKTWTFTYALGAIGKDGREVTVNTAEGWHTLYADEREGMRA